MSMHCVIDAVSCTHIDPKLPHTISAGLVIAEISKNYPIQAPVDCETRLLVRSRFSQVANKFLPSRVRYVRT